MSAQPPPIPPEATAAETVSYVNVRVVVFPEAPQHYDVNVADETTVSHHAVERVVLNNTLIEFEEPLWFVDADVHVGVPRYAYGDTAWVWL